MVTTLRSKRVRVHLLGTSKTPSDNPVRRLFEATGGSVIEQPDARRWTASLLELLRAAAPPRIANEPVQVRFVAPLPAIGPLGVSTWNQVWARESITPLGVAATGEGERILAALWNAGVGRVAAAAFSPPPPIADELAKLVAAPPRDPRYRVRWDCGPMLRVRIDAVESDRLLNDLPFRLQLLDDGAKAGTQVSPIPQISPGRYELSVPAPRRAVIGVVRLGDAIISRHAVAGRYAPEFDEIGLNRRILERLAATTGGRVIEPGDVRPIEFAHPTRRVHLTGWLAATGALLIAAGLVHWRLT
jgi:hypothetical protein